MGNVNRTKQLSVHLLHILSYGGGDVPQTFAQLGDLIPQTGHALHHIIQSLPQLQVLLRGQTPHRCRESSCIN